MEQKKNNNQKKLTFLVNNGIIIFIISLLSCEIHSKGTSNELEIRNHNAKCSIPLINREDDTYIISLNKFKNYSNNYINDDEKCYLYAIMLSKMDNEIFGNYRFYLDSLYQQALNTDDRILLTRLYQLSISTGLFDVLEVKRREKIQKIIDLRKDIRDYYVLSLLQIEHIDIKKRNFLRDSIYMKIELEEFDSISNLVRQ